jgi:helicase required for RNAi-mediated heterochromatin assembly 1
MFELRQAAARQMLPGNTQGSAIRALLKLSQTIQRELQYFAIEETAEYDLIDHKVLLHYGLITEDQCNSFETGDTGQDPASEDEPTNPLRNWLGTSAVRVASIGLDQFAEFEEETKLMPDEIQEREAEVFTDEHDELRGDYIPINQNIEGRGMKITKLDASLILSQQNMWNIPQRSRGSLYNYFIGEIKARARAALRELGVRYAIEAQRFKYGRMERDLDILKDQKVIGMTTTGLNKYRALVHALSPRVVIIEEAAEALEAPVVAGACVESLQHLILVGDHQQLRPSCSVHDLKGEPFHLDISLFERLIDNGLPFKMLKTQRRMIPEIRRLLYPIYGNQIQDHELVKTRSKDIPGMAVNSFLWAHREPEHKDASMSTANDAEAEMLVGHCCYLIANGVSAKKITILTFYNAQKQWIEKLVRQKAKEAAHGLGYSSLSFDGIKIATVDSYQGEENDIILLSLVRSNEKGTLGFSGVPNRICVALSRARIGLYIYCNIHLFADHSQEWNDVYSIMSGRGTKSHVGYELPLICSQHRNVTKIKNAMDWQRNNGGCDRACGKALPCGHVCADRCHPGDHGEYKCLRQCSKIIESCGHKCSLQCHEECICSECASSAELLVGVKHLLD